MKIQKIFFLVVLITVLAMNAFSVFAQYDSTGKLPDICKTWQTEEMFISGKAVDTPEIVEIVVTFNEDGTYQYWEENELTEGDWVLENDGSSIVFDKGTEDELIWDILTLEAANLQVKFAIDKKNYKYTFKPKQNQ
ncbi:hypothetical protein D4R99_03625 [bacterium]|nr:MAG: hypothetical protein D4R99_03625 [bacterium]